MNDYYTNAKNKKSSLSKRNIDVSINKKILSLNMEINANAAVDINDSYTEINPKKVEAYIDGKPYFSDPASDSFSIKYPIAYSYNDRQEILVDLSYKDYFHTKVTVNVHWLDPDEFEELKKEYAKDKNHIYKNGEIVEEADPENFEF